MLRKIDNPTTPLESLANLLVDKADITKRLDNLHKMRGKDEDGSARGGFSVESHHAIGFYIPDPDLNSTLVDVCITHYTRRLSSIDLLLGLAERAVTQQLNGRDVLEVLREYQEDHADDSV